MRYSQKLQHARAELHDAKGAYDRADENGLMRYISNCLAATRSVLQYALDEIGPAGSPARNWYDTAVGADDLFRFMKDLRDDDIHSAPVETANTGLVLNTGGPGWIKTDPATNKVIDAKLPDGEYVRVLMKAAFGSRPENALDLLDEYITKAQALIADGKSKGFLR